MSKPVVFDRTATRGVSSSNPAMHSSSYCYGLAYLRCDRAQRMGLSKVVGRSFSFVIVLGNGYSNMGTGIVLIR